MHAPLAHDTAPSLSRIVHLHSSGVWNSRLGTGEGGGRGGFLSCPLLGGRVFVICLFGFVCALRMQIAALVGVHASTSTRSTHAFLLPCLTVLNGLRFPLHLSSGMTRSDEGSGLSPLVTPSPEHSGGRGSSRLVCPVRLPVFFQISQDHPFSYSTRPSLSCPCSFYRRAQMPPRDSRQPSASRSSKYCPSQVSSFPIAPDVAQLNHAVLACPCVLQQSQLPHLVLVTSAQV